MSKYLGVRLTLTTTLVISVCVVDSVTIAYDGSLMGSLNAMPAYANYFTLTTATTSLNTAATFIGAILLSPLAAPLINWRGRKCGIYVSALVQIIGAILQGSAQGIAMFIVGRLLIGAGSGLAQTSAATYVAETVPSRIRAFALGLYFTCWAVGALLAAGVCYGTASMENSDWSWRTPSLIQAVPSVMAILVLFALPESPRWLAYKSRSDEALSVLSAINGANESDPNVQIQYREIMDTIAFEKSDGQKLGYSEVIKKSNLRRLMLAVSVAPLAMLTGSNIITFYFSTMLEQAGITDANTQLQINVILSAWQLVVAFSGSILAERIGRRMLALCSLGSCTVFFYMLGGLTARYGESTNASGIYGTIACIFLFLGAYSFGITPLTVMYQPEVLSYSVRATGMSIATVVSKGCGLLVTFAFPFALEVIGWKTYMINATFNVLLWAFIAYFWVETKGLTLEEVDEIFDGTKHSDAPALADFQAERKDIIEGVEIASPVDVSVRIKT
ncbi:hexose transporter [Diplodia corticola]|uniref:Hexose transporter n=1 Tax=Diplodia corticola TaxID=236234 RepID=A0A1J9QPX4_9PEZI|nr:hexose transporter [Diplodia corticola]OJD30974.1 hexose transporter [Diplodia corticola]